MPSITGEQTSEVSLDFEVFCGGCGAGICSNCTEGNTPRRGMPFITVNPCEKCLDRSNEEGYNKGYDDGYTQGQKDEQNNQDNQS